jgi:hypothetical protein
MNLEIYKDRRNRNTGKFHRRVPANTDCKKVKADTLKEITKYIQCNDDFGQFNYINFESRVTTKLDPYTTYVYEDLY